MTRAHFSLLLISLIPCPLAAQESLTGGLGGAGSGDQVTASLVSENDGIAPGQPFTVALKLEHAPMRHTYWLNPGIGQPTTITWNLPDGFKAGPIEWPVPEVHETELGNQHVYEGTVYLLTTIAAPDTVSGTVAIQAVAKWLVCEDGGSCVPGSKSLTLNLAVKDSPQPVTAAKAAIDKVRAVQPKATDAWTIGSAISDAVVEEDGDKVEVKNLVVSLTPGPNANPSPGKIYFFDAAKAIELKPQKAVPKDGGWMLTVQMDPDAETQAAGFLHAANGWLKDGTLAAIPFAVEGEDPFAAEKEAEPATSSRQPAAGAAPHVDRPDEWEVESKPEDYVEYRDNLTTADLRRSAGGGKTERGFFVILGLIFLGGMILNLMPCVFPVLGIKVLGFARLAGHDRKKLLTHAAAYAAGIIVFIWMLGGAMLLAKVIAGRELTWGFFTQNATGLGFIVLLLFLLGLNLWGVFEIGTSLTGVGGELQEKEGLAGSFWSGALTSIVSTPCSGPFLGVAMTYAFGQPPLQQFILLTAFGLGIAFPFGVLSTSPKLLKKLPRPGAWMETFKKALAFPMFAAAIYFLNAFMQQTGASGTTLLLCGLLVAAIGAWVYGHWGTPMRAVRTRWIANLTALAVVIWGGWLMWTGSRERTKDTAIEEGWLRWSPRTVRDLRDQRKTVFVDYTTYG